MGRQHHRNRAQDVAVVLTALGVRLAAGWWLGHFANPVALEYEHIANNLLAGQGFLYEHLGTPYRAFVLPVYPFFCTAVYKITNHSQTALLVLQCLISALACLQVRVIGVFVFRDPLIAKWGAWFVAFHPGLIIYASRLHPLTLDLLAFLWVFWAWLCFLREPTWLMAVHVGLSSGFALLSRGTVAVFLLFAMGWFLQYVSLRRGKAIKRLGLVVIVGGTLVTPWLVRNAIHLHSFPVFQTTASEVFWRGNNPLASGSAYLSDGRSVLSGASEAFHRQLSQLDELGQSRFFRQEAWRFIRERPVWALRLYGEKFFSFWWFSPQTGLTYPPMYRQAYLAFYIPAALLALIGLWKVRWSLLKPHGLLLLGFVLSIATVQSFYYVEGRHRWTVEPLLLLLSAAGGLTLLGKVPSQTPSH